MKQKAEILNWYSYMPHWPWDTVNISRQCRFSVHDTGRGVGMHQCHAKGKIKIEGRWWCGRHAKKIEAALAQCAD